LLKDSLTLETSYFSGLFAVPEWGEYAHAAILNPMFTMTARCDIPTPPACGFALALV
jgi:hypothetical protein